MNKFSVIAVLRKRIFPVVFLVVCVIAPICFKNSYFHKVLSEIFFYASLAVAWNLVGGYARQTSWAHETFFAMGAYSAMLLYMRLNVSPWLGLFIGVAAAMILSVCIGLPTFKLRGTYFAIATIACAAIIKQLLLYFSDFTGGANGLVLQASTGNSLWFLRFDNEIVFYYIAFILMLVCVFISYKIKNSRIGYYLGAIREDEDAAETLGIHTYRIKLLILMISAAMTAVVGSFYAFRLGYIDPNAVASHDVAVRIGVTAIIGGLNTVWGPVLGAVLTVPLFQLANKYFGNLGGGGMSWVIYGLTIILFTIYQPGGILAIWAKIKERRALKKAARSCKPITKTEASTIKDDDDNEKNDFENL
jgi:branched-chain amino acid transport system permease protein